MAHQFPYPSSTPLPLVLQEMSPDTERLLATTRSAQSAEIINEVRASAMIEYYATKKEKQDQLAARVSAALRTGDKTTFKNAKKKVDNHASSVASRCRRSFLITRFENLVREKTSQNHQLCEVIQRMHNDARKMDAEMRRVLMKKDVEIRRMQWKINKLSTEVESLIAHIAKNQHQSHAPSSAQPVRESNWHPDALSMETLAYSSTVASASPEASFQEEIDVLGELSHPNITLEELQVADPEGDDLASFMDRSSGSPISFDYRPMSLMLPTQSSLNGSSRGEGEIKPDGTGWASPTPLLDLRSAQAQMKADTPSNILYPAV